MISAKIYSGDYGDTVLKTWENLDYEVYRYELKLVEVYENKFSMHICSLYDYETLDTFVVNLLFYKRDSSPINANTPFEDTGVEFNATFAVKIGCGVYFFEESSYRIIQEKIANIVYPHSAHAEVLKQIYSRTFCGLGNPLCT